MGCREGRMPEAASKGAIVRRAALVPTLLLVLLVGVDAGAQGLDLRIGGFYPRLRDCGIPSNVPAEYTLFQDVCELYAVDQNAFDGVYGGIEYNHVVMKNVELAVSIDGSSETFDTFYRDYERPGGGNIFQTLRLQTLPIGLSVRFIPTSKRTRIAPYVGGGIDAVVYEYEEFGDFIDFFDPDFPNSAEIIPDHFVDDGAAFGLHVLAGIRVPVSDDISIIGEARYLWAKTDMDDDFRANEIDLGGLSATAGISIRF
jgi:opacity protein-like surface antigen